MIGFEPGSSGIGSNHTVNCVATIAPLQYLFFSLSLSQSLSLSILISIFFKKIAAFSFIFVFSNKHYNFFYN